MKKRFQQKRGPGERREGSSQAAPSLATEPARQRRPLRVPIALLGLGALLGIAFLLAPKFGGQGSPPRQDRTVSSRSSVSSRGSASSHGSAFVPNQACAECHRQQFDDWSGSDHDLAMQHASEESVLGDFNDATFSHFDQTTRFFRKDGQFLVNTEGPDGKAADFQIQYTFGVKPLQQYLIEFPGGRLQSLTTAWDTQGKRWFHLYPDEKIAPDDALHWTGRYQVWNHTCAICHSTDLRKNYDPDTDSYATTWAEINVSCQACHGPGEAHVEWARSLPEGAATEEVDYKLAPVFLGDKPEIEIQTCAPCHSRRHQLRAAANPGEPFLDGFMVETLREGLYHADGQILDEVYVYGSFIQSKMHQKGVRCTDCHNPHSARLQSPGNGVCARCHQMSPPEEFSSLKAKEYETREHHFHVPGSEGAECVNCHAPTRTYMGVDPRRDHSFRVPRPDLSVKLGTPNACNDCHEDQTPEWAVATVTKWYGPERRQEAHFAEAITAGRRAEAGAESKLIRLAMDAEQPAIARATALELLQGFGVDGGAAMMLATKDSDALVRTLAVSGLNRLPPGPRLDSVAPLLSDPIRSVRIEAARVLASVPAENFKAPQRGDFEAALKEYEDAQMSAADMPSAHMNLGRLRADMGEMDLAVEHYQTAWEMDSRFAAAPLELARLHNENGKNAEAEQVLREALKGSPEEGEIYYSLGLLLAEEQRLEEAEVYLRQAAQRLPRRARVFYNHSLALQRLDRRAEGEQQLLRAYEIGPTVPDTVNALVIYYLQERRLHEALRFARELVSLAPGDPGAQQMVQRIEAELSAL